MKSYTTLLRALMLLYLVSYFLSGSIALAQEPDLDGLASRLGKQIVKAGINSVVVADFVTKQGEASPEGYYLAGELSQGLAELKKRFRVAGRSQLSEALSHAQLLPKDLTVADSLQRIGNSVQVDAVVTGTLDATSARYLVTVTLRAVKDGSLLDSEHQTIKRPAIAEGMALLASKALPEQLSVAGRDGVGIPTCEYCPPPSYTDEARNAKWQGNVVLVAIVTSEGRAGKIVATRGPNESITKKAVEAARDWKFKPATDKEGKAVSVLVPIEVTFRLY